VSNSNIIYFLKLLKSLLQTQVKQVKVLGK